MWGARAGLAPSPELPSQRELWRDPGQAWAGSATGVWGLGANEHKPGSLSPAGLCPEDILWHASPYPTSARSDHTSKGIHGPFLRSRPSQPHCVRDVTLNVCSNHLGPC